MKLKIGKQLVDLSGYCELEFGDFSFIFAKTRDKSVVCIFQMDSSIFSEFFSCQYDKFDPVDFYYAFKSKHSEYTYLMDKFFNKKELILM